ncbi:similar to Saccharomyces cerevisiae YCR075W-A Putative protein of unknown function [Maudiozyma barnettii]|uniref:Uncharacterized protein n=1 Tax=Maudiozyma barnettii TaxID=61262 RepID=A0A8H2VGJ3_9SACH|nr:Ego2p [Kazachstania barnettii]CAB4254774.1 similar to Saccharomyces cerevisiae YCR075W-A Putative protein of unknown function [Kazachstania barnettii]CAD1782911.1 similar to Saccharomyces cerevisiae YCR075W-A Putative protein of unknown function [Kazachstania barnettii]
MSDSATGKDIKPVGTLVFDENNNILLCSGIGKSRKQDITQLATLQVDDEGFATVEDKQAGLKVSLYRDEDMTTVLYSKA